MFDQKWFKGTAGNCFLERLKYSDFLFNQSWISKMKTTSFFSMLSFQNMTVISDYLWHFNFSEPPPQSEKYWKFATLETKTFSNKFGAPERANIFKSSKNIKYYLCIINIIFVERRLTVIYLCALMCVSVCWCTSRGSINCYTFVMVLLVIKNWRQISQIIEILSKKIRSRKILKFPNTFLRNQQENYHHF